MIPMNSPAKLTDTQFAILSEASQRKDRCLIPPKTLKAAAAQKVATKLLTAGLVRETKAKTGMEAWRRDEETGQAYSLKLTDAGLKAIAADAHDSQSRPSAALSQNANGDSSNARIAGNPASRSTIAAPTSPAPRQGTKIALVVELLQRDQGAKLDELIDATGWLPHTARAALTGLRHRGYDVRLERGENGRASVYRALATLALAS
jgi:DNA-binding IclR family transcriptional regulator